MRTRPTSSVTVGDPTSTPDLLRELERDGRFRRDGRLGAIFHPGKISFREMSSTESLHILIDGDRVSAHVDEISPLVIGPDGACRYSWGRVLAHNVIVAVADVARRLRGDHDPPRCDLRCQVEWVDDDQDAHPGSRT